MNRYQYHTSRITTPENTMKLKLNRLLCRSLITITTLTLLTACASSAEAAKDDTVGVGIESLNYSGKEVAYIAVEKPGEPNGGGGGDALNPYSSGGTICCFSIPKKWHPDFKVVIKYQFYPETEYRRQLVSVAPYAAGKPGDIWLIVHADETVEAVVSDFGPTREEWPGKIKGYPVASREYLLKIWEKKVVETKNDIARYEKSIKEFSSESAKEQWKYTATGNYGMFKNELKEFSGPDDPKYIEKLKNDNKKGLDFYTKKLQSLLRNKP